MARRIVITSGQGGVGKTSIVANLGAKLSRAGNRVVVMDLDIGLNNLDVACGVENKVLYDIIDVIEGRCRPAQALLEVEGYPNLWVMPSAHTLDKNYVNGQNVRLVVEKLNGICDYILMDCPAGIELGFHRAVAAAEEAIVVTTPHISAVRDADRVIRLLKAYRLSSVSLVVNRARGDLMLSGEMMEIADINELLKTKIIGVIPEDDEMPLSTAAGGMVSACTQPDIAFNLLADNLLDGEGELYDVTVKYRGFFGAIKRGLRRRV